MRRRVRRQSPTRRLIVGWSRTKVAVPGPGPILDLGSGAFPNRGADILCDGSLEDSRHRHGLAAVVDRPMVVARAEALPFRDGAIAFVVASHIAEHVEDPDAFCREVARVAQAGYIETPSPLADRMLEEEYHLWRVSDRSGELTFTHKTSHDRRPRRSTEIFYRVYNAGGSCASPTMRLPAGWLGRLFGAVLLVVRALLNRSGIMHTRLQFGSGAELRWRVSSRTRPELTLISRLPRSGFLDADRRALAESCELREIEYPGFPGARFVWRVVRAAFATDGVYGFFASEHMLVPAAVFRLMRRSVVVSVGGYDVAGDRERGYGLAASRWRRWLPATVLRLADVVLPFSASAEAELLAEFPRASRKIRRLYLGIDLADWERPGPQVERSGVVTVGYVNEESWSRKGIDRFVELARRDPMTAYVLAGRVDPKVAAYIEPRPPNLEMTGYLSHEDLRELLWRSAVYAQLSWHEGFGLAVLEAMACGCTPFVTDVPALVEVAGEWAVVASAEDRARDLAGVHDALARAATTDRTRMSQWIEARFSAAARADVLASLVADLIGR